LFRQITTTLPLAKTRAEKTSLRQPSPRFMSAGGALGVVAVRGKRDAVVRLGGQAGDGVLRDPGGIAVLALLG